MVHTTKSQQNLLRGANSGELRAVLKAVFASGVRYRMARSGIIVYGPPDTTPVVIHLTASDHRAVKNLTRDLSRIGIKVKGKK